MRTGSSITIMPSRLLKDATVQANHSQSAASLHDSLVQKAGKGEGVTDDILTTTLVAKTEYFSARGRGFETADC